MIMAEISTERRYSCKHVASLACATGIYSLCVLSYLPCCIRHVHTVPVLNSMEILP